MGYDHVIVRFTSRKSKILLWSVAIAMAFGVLSPAILIWAFAYRRGWGLIGLDLALGAWLLGGLAVFIPGSIWILRNNQRWKLKVVATIVGSILVGYGADRLAAGPVNTIEIINSTGSMVTRIITSPIEVETTKVFDDGRVVDVPISTKRLGEMHIKENLHFGMIMDLQFHSWMNPTHWYWAAWLEDGRVCAGRSEVTEVSRAYTIELIDQPITSEFVFDAFYTMPSLFQKLGPMLDSIMNDSPSE